MENQTKEITMQINSLDADGDESYLFVFTIPDGPGGNWEKVKKIIHDAASDWAKSDFKSFRDSTDLYNPIEGNPSAEELVPSARPLILTQGIGSLAKAEVSDISWTTSRFSLFLPAFPFRKPCAGFFRLLAPGFSCCPFRGQILSFPGARPLAAGRRSVLKPRCPLPAPGRAWCLQACALSRQADCRCP